MNNILNSLPQKIIDCLNLEPIENANVLNLVERLHVLSSYNSQIKNQINGMKSQCEKDLLLSQVDFIASHKNAIKNQLRFIRKKSDVALGLDSWSFLLKEAEKVISKDAKSLRKSHEVNGEIIDKNLKPQGEILYLEELSQRIKSAIL